MGICGLGAQPIFYREPGDTLEFADIVRHHCQIARFCLTCEKQVKPAYGLSSACKRRPNFACGNCVLLIQRENGKVPEKKGHGFEIMIDPLAFVGSIVKLMHHHD